jgi:maltooligosyltrehalose trehalohydrolase
MDALWNDDFHHSAHVAMTGRSEAYYSDFFGSPQEFVSALKYGYLFQGQLYSWQEGRRGTPALDLPPAHFVNFLQNHDQVANSSRGLRGHLISSPGRYRALTALLLLAPSTPMLFQGQEFAASAPFHYFADHQPDLAKLVAAGRIEFMKQFPSLVSPASASLFLDPHKPSTFEACKLDFAEREKNRGVHDMHRYLLRLRREHPLFRLQQRRVIDGAVLGPSAFVLRWFADDGRDHLMLVNLGRDLHLRQAPEPLLAPPRGQRWALLWSSEDVRFGGGGTTDLETEDGWIIPGEAAFVVQPRPVKPGEPEAPRRKSGKPARKRES